MKKIAVYPGSFDPITNGHLDIIKRANEIFAPLVVAVVDNPNKEHLFTMEERVEIIKEVTKDCCNIKVDSFKGLLTDYLQQLEAQIIVRGLRAVSDFENEFQMALMNKKLAPNIETIFMMTRTEYAYLSSSTVKEVASYDGCIEDLVPQAIIRRIKQKLKDKDLMIK